MDTLKIILDHGLSIRQIPLQVVSVYDFRHFKDGDEVLDLPNGVKRVRRVKVPDHAGWWMVQKVGHTSSQVHWSYKQHPPAPTLDDAVKAYLATLTA